MKILLEAPVYYSKELMYVANVKEYDFFIDSDPIDISIANRSLAPAPPTVEVNRAAVVNQLHGQVTPWFTNPLTIERLHKDLQFVFTPLNYPCEQKHVRARWIPTHFQIKSKGFFLLFTVHTFLEANLRIPANFLDSATPVATAPKESAKPEKLVRNIVIQPVPPNPEMEDVNDIPLSDVHGSLEIDMDDGRKIMEKQRLRQAKLRAAIARLKVEEMKERYLRHYGLSEEVSDSDEDASSVDSEFSESPSKKL